MAFSYNEYIGDGVTKSFPFGFTGPGVGYIREEDIVVEIGGIRRYNFTLTSSNTLEMSEPPVVGSIIRIRRVMPKDAPYSDFARGNKFGADNLNNSFLQTLYTVHEFQDGWFPEGFRFLNPVKFSGPTDFEGNDIVNVGVLEVQDVQIGTSNLTLQEAIEESYNWAQHPVNTPVPEGNGSEFSAYHYSVKADDARNVAVGAEFNSTQAAFAAAGFRDEAEGHKNAAASSASSASSSASSALSRANSALSSANASASSASAASGFADDASDSAAEALAHANSALGYRTDAQLASAQAGIRAQEAKDAVDSLNSTGVLNILDFGATLTPGWPDWNAQAINDAYAAAVPGQAIRVPAGEWDVNWNLISLPGNKYVKWETEGATLAGSGAPFFNLAELAEVPGTFEVSSPDNGHEFRRNVTEGADKRVLAVRRVAENTDGSGVSTALNVRTDVGENVPTFEWGILSRLENHANTSGENVAMYGQIRKYGSSPSWAGVFEARDYTSGTSGCHALELDIVSNGTDPDNVRSGIMLVNWKNDLGGAKAEAGYGISIHSQGNNWANSKFKTGIAMLAEFDTGIDFSQGNILESAIKLGLEQPITFGTRYLKGISNNRIETDAEILPLRGLDFRTAYDESRPTIRMGDYRSIGFSTGSIRGTPSDIEVLNLPLRARRGLNQSSVESTYAMKIGLNPIKWGTNDAYEISPTPAYLGISGALRMVTGAREDAIQLDDQVGIHFGAGGPPGTANGGVCLFYNRSVNSVVFKYGRAQFNESVNFTVNSASATATAGSAGAPPAAVQGYITMYMNGVPIKVPYYSN